MLYCKSNPYYWSPPNHPVRPSHPVVKVGLVNSPGRTPEDRDRELFTTGVPSEFKTEFKRKVDSVRQWEGWIHQYFELKGLRTDPRREFVIATLDEVRTLFELIPGTWVLDDEEPPPPALDEDGDDVLPAVGGSERWSLDGIRAFIAEEWSEGESFLTASLYDLLEFYCRSHSFPYYPRTDGVTKPHLASLGLILKQFVGEGLLKMRRGNGNKAIYTKPVIVLE